LGIGNARCLMCLVLLTLVTSCAAPATPSPSSAGVPDVPRPTAKKRLTLAVLGVPFTLSSHLAVGGTGNNQPGSTELEKLTNPGLTIQTSRGPREASLAEAVPSTDNGLWKVLPDGRMETTWRIRDGARWHDGTPLTSADLLFTLTAATDRELPFIRRPLFDFIERSEAADARTIVVYWKRPFIQADQLFGEGGSMPLPEHLLGRPFAENKANFANLPYWREEFVGLGPYRLASWVEGTHLTMEANPDYVLGRPKIDEIEARFIPSPGTITANILAGAVDMTMGRGLSIEQALEIRGQWRDGKVEVAVSENPTILNPQHLTPNPAIVTDVRFKRAMLHALDRAEMAETLQGGLVPVAHSGLPPNDPEFAEAEAMVVKYEYDPRRSMQLLEELGYRRGADGILVDAANQRLAVEVRSSSTDLYIRTALAVASFWQRLGLSTEPVIVPDARERDLEYRATFPGFEAVSTGAGIDGLTYYRRSELRTARDGFRGRNRSGYVNDELEPLLDRYFTTVPHGERNRVLGQILFHISDQLAALYLFHNGHTSLIGNRVRNVNPQHFQSQESWNAHEWDLN
jgi:peptide/nickel transport system substrate-binding protein